MYIILQFRLTASAPVMANPLNNPLDMPEAGSSSRSSGHGLSKRCMESRAEPSAPMKPSPTTGERVSVPRSWDATSSDHKRGPWGDEEWKGWWGDNPVFHTPVFVLTHHPRPALQMEGGTTFHFMEATPREALMIAKDAAGELDVRIGGGPSTVRAFLAADLIDQMHVVITPIVLGRGERLWDGLEGLEERFDVEAVSTPSGVTHVTFSR